VWWLLKVDGLGAEFEGVKDWKKKRK